MGFLHTKAKIPFPLPSDLDSFEKMEVEEEQDDYEELSASDLEEYPEEDGDDDDDVLEERDFDDLSSLEHDEL